jgi:hypothetical protein
MGVARGPRPGLWEVSNLLVYQRLGRLNVTWRFGLQAAHEVVVGLLGVIQTASVVDGNMLTLLRVVNTVALNQSLLFNAHDVIEMCI